MEWSGHAETSVVFFIRLWRWKIFDSQDSEETTEESSDFPKDDTIEPKKPLESIASSTSSSAPKVSSPEPSTSDEPAKTASTSKTVPQAESNTVEESSESGLDRETIALVLNRELEGAVWKMVRRMWTRFRRIFRIQIPVLQLEHGFDNPAHTGMMLGYSYAVKSVLPWARNWEFQPRWDQEGLGRYQVEVLVHMNLLRILLFVMVSLWSGIRLFLLIRRLQKQYRENPRFAGLSNWRRKILDLLVPLAEGKIS